MVVFDSGGGPICSGSLKTAKNGRLLSMAKIYTRTGDDGETSLLGGVRVRKDDLRIETIGCVDETNAAIGVVRTELGRDGGSTEVDATPAIAFNTSFSIWEQSWRHGQALRLQFRSATRTWLSWSRLSIALKVAWSRCGRLFCRGDRRRLGSCIWRGVSAAGRNGDWWSWRQLNRSGGELVKYLNRLSDLLFVLARVVNKASGVADVEWQKGEGGGGKGEG